MTEDTHDPIEREIATLDTAEHPVASAEAIVEALVASADADTYPPQEAWIGRLEECYEVQRTPLVRSALIRGLAAATTVDNCLNRKTELTAEDVERYRNRLEELYDDNADSEAAEWLAFATSQLVASYATDSRLEDISLEIQRLTRLHESHRQEAIAASLADALVTEAGLHFTLDQGRTSKIDANYQFVESLAREYPGERLDERLAGALSYSARASYEREHLNYALTERTASRIEGLYQRYRSDELAYWLAHGTHPKVWALGSQEKFQATEAEIERIEQLVDTHDDERLPRLLGWYYRNEVYNRVGAERSVEVEQTLDRLTTFYESYAEWESVPEYYADALRSAVKFYFEQENFEAAEQKLELITTLTDTHDPTETAVSSRYARALARGVEANVERGEIDTAMAYYDRIRELVDDDNDVGSPLTEATKALADRILAAENLDELERIVTDLWSVVEASTDRFVAAELQTRANLTRGHWWPDDGEFQVTIEEETASTVTVSVSDQYELEHVITVGTDGSVSTNTGEGDIPETIGDLSPFQQQLAQFVRGYAAYWLDREHDVDVLSPESKPESIEAVSKAIAELSTEEVDELFGEYLAQHASHWNDTAPFVDEVKRPVDPVGIDLENEVVLYEVWVSIEDGTVAGVSDIQIAVLDDDERTVLREASVPDGETYALVSLPVRFVVTPELLQLVMGEHLRCQCRDRYVALGMEPPVESRILGPGQQSLTSLYTEYDSVPDFHNPEANVAGYEPGTAPEMLVAKHIQNVLYEDVAWARDVLDHLEGTPTTAPIPPTITAPTNTWRGDQ